MPSPREDHLYDLGRNGGGRPDNSDTQGGWDAFNRGREQRDLDRSTNDALEKLHNPDYANRNKF